MDGDREMMVTTSAAKPLPQWRLSVPSRPLTGLTVLVIEDSRFASEAVRLLCLKSGARVRRADCLRSAARHLKAYRPAVVVVDLGLPDGDGVSLIDQLHTQEPRVPVILAMSGDPGREDEALAAGADGFLPKPVESLAVFQQAILRSMPAEAGGRGLRLLPNEVIRPDSPGLRDDLVYATEVLASVEDGAEINYIARFLAGVARSAHDPALEAAAAALAREHNTAHTLTSELAQITSMVQDRISGTASM